jgi:hypothetical protein
MSDDRRPRTPGVRDWILILTVFAAAVFGAAWLGRIGARSTNVAAAVVITAGTATLAAMTRRFSGLPTWATLVSVGILGVSAIAGAAFWSQNAAWHHAIKDSLWMHPWYFLTLAGVTGPSSGCACGPGSRLFSWLFIGVAFVIAVLVPIVAVLT